MPIEFEHGVFFRDRSGQRTDEFPTPLSLASARHVARFWTGEWRAEVGLFQRTPEGDVLGDAVEWVAAQRTPATP